MTAARSSLTSGACSLPRPRPLPRALARAAVAWAALSAGSLASEVCRHAPDDPRCLAAGLEESMALLQVASAKHNAGRSAASEDPDVSATPTEALPAAETAPATAAPETAAEAAPAPVAEAAPATAAPATVAEVPPAAEAPEAPQVTAEATSAPDSASVEANAAATPPVDAPTETVVVSGVPITSTATQPTAAPTAPPTPAPVSVETQPVLQDVQSTFGKLSGTKSFLLKANIDVAFQGYDKGHMPYSEHFQSIQRAQNSTVFYISGSGQTAQTAQVFVVNLASRSSNGAMGVAETDSSLKAPSADAVVDILSVDKEYRHAGGMSAFENILAVGTEPDCSPEQRVTGGCQAAGRIHFYDISDPLHPTKLPHVLERSGVTAGTTSLTRQGDGKFLLAVGGTDAKQIDFYVSTSSSLFEGDPGWRFATSWTSNNLLVAADNSGDYGAYQTMNFVRQVDGSLFLVGLYRSLEGLGYDYADLFQIYTQPTGVSMLKQKGVKVTCLDATCNFQAGAGLYVASPDLLLLYGTNWEPEWKDGSIYIGEFRPATVGEAGSCGRRTTGTCSFFGCASSRGPTDCVDGQCLCSAGYCADVMGACQREV